MEVVIFLIVSFLAAFTATMAGFGASTVLIPVAIYFMGTKLAIYFTAIFHLVTNAFKIRLFIKSIDKKIFIQFGIPSILFAFLGAYLAVVFPEQNVKKILAYFLIAFSLFTLFNPRFSIASNPFNTIFGGSLSGFFAGLVGLGGAMRGAFLSAFDLPKSVYVATSSLIAFAVDLTRIPVYATSQTEIDKHYYLLLPFLVLTAYAGTSLGKKYLDRINQKTFKKIIAAALFITGIKLLAG